MSEKVKVTVKQKEAIDRLNEYQLEQIKDFKKNPEKYADWVSPLNELPEKKIIDALYIGYEVEPEFLIGDTVINKETGIIEKVDGYMTTILERYSDKYRHATPSEIAEEKERRFFARHGRKPWELREGDVLQDKEDGYTATISFVSKSNEVHFEDEISYHLSSIKKYCKVVCFAESRLDVKTNE
jgi:hypothetical protein